MRNAWGKKIDPTRRIATAHPATFRNLFSESISMLPRLFVFNSSARCRCRHPAQTSLARRLCFTASDVAHYAKTIATAGADRFTFVAVSFAIFAGAAWHRQRAREMAELFR